MARCSCTVPILKFVSLHRNSFFIGCVLTTLVLIWFSWNSYYPSKNTTATANTGNFLQKILFKGAPPSLAVRNLNQYFTAAASLGSPIEKEINWPETLTEEYRGRKAILGLVLTSVSKLEQTVGITNETWGASLSDYRIFVRGDSTGLKRFPVITLKLGKTTTAVNELFALLKFVHANYLDVYNWFIVVPDETYVAGEELEEVLYKFDPQSIVYVGKAGSTNLVKMFQQRMMANEYFCESGPGIVLSNGALKAIVPHLDQCLTHTEKHNRKAISRSQLHLPDVELGRCFSRWLGVQCSTSPEAQRYFYHDEKNDSLSSEKLWSSIVFQQSLTVFPIQDATHMRKVHLFFKTRKVEELKRRLLLAENSAYKQCTSLCNDSQSVPVPEEVVRKCNVTPLVHHQGPTHYNLSQPFIQSKPAEVTDYIHIDTDFEYYHDSEKFEPRFETTNDLVDELHYVTKEAVEIVNQEEAANYKFRKFENGYVRYTHTRGREYILDLVLSGDQGVVQRRIHLLRIHQPNLVVLPDSTEDSRNVRINFIVPFTHVNQRFNEFLVMYESACLKTKENVRLVLAVFGKNDVKFVTEIIKQYKIKYPHMEYEIVQDSQKFSRARAKALGMSILNGTELAFVCDIDMTIQPAFLSHCRMNTIRGKRVYFPECFKFYDMNYVYRLSRPPPIGNFDIRRKHGHWAAYGVGMLCIYKSDYEVVGGFDTSIEGWGGEDVDLYRKIIRKYEILKAPDPALSHRFHDKHCSGNLSPIQFNSCITSREEGIADRKELTEYVFYLEQKCHVTDRQLWN